MHMMTFNDRMRLIEAQIKLEDVCMGEEDDFIPIKREYKHEDLPSYPV